MSFQIYSLGVITILFLGTCHQPVLKPEPALLHYFTSIPAADTLRFEVAEDSETLSGDTIPNSLFFTEINPEWLQEIDYLADSSAALVLGLQRIPLNDSTDVCLVDIRQAWFRHQSLLVYDKQRRDFAGRVTVAEFYGGDGGQLLTGTWMLDYDGDGDKDLLRREISHGLIPDGDEVKEYTDESALLLIWNGDRFIEQPVSDTALVVKRFPIRSVW